MGASLNEARKDARYFRRSSFLSFSASSPIETMGPMPAVHSKLDEERPRVALFNAVAAFVGPPNNASLAEWMASILRLSSLKSKQVRRHAIAIFVSRTSTCLSVSACRLRSADNARPPSRPMLEHPDRSNASSCWGHCDADSGRRPSSSTREPQTRSRLREGKAALNHLIECSCKGQFPTSNDISEGRLTTTATSVWDGADWSMKHTPLTAV